MHYLDYKSEIVVEADHLMIQQLTWDICHRTMMHYLESKIRNCCETDHLTYHASTTYLGYSPSTLRRTNIALCGQVAYTRFRADLRPRFPGASSGKSKHKHNSEM